MRRISEELLIYDPEETYVKRLAEELLLKKEIQVGVRTCSSLEYMEQLLEISRIRVLLVSDEIPYERRKKIFPGKRIVLTREQCVDLGTEETELIKYQSVDKLAEVILRCLAEDAHGIKRAGGCRGRIIGVYSPVHRVGKTTFSLKIGRELAENEKVLYLNLEACAGIGGYFREEEGSDLSHLLYYAKQESDVISVRLTSIVHRMGKLDYISPMRVGTDLRTVSVKEWKSLFKILLEKSVYRTIIVDIGDSVEDIFKMLKLCDWIFVPYTDDIYSMAKMKQWKYMLRVLKQVHLEQHCVYVKMDKPIRQIVARALEEWKSKEGM